VSVTSASKIVFSANLGTGYGIATSNDDGTGAFQVTTDFGNTPSWSPDGQRIAYRGEDYSIWIVNADGTNRTQLTTAGWGAVFCQDIFVHWSPDGTKVVVGRTCSADPSNPSALTDPLLIVDVATKAVTQLPVNGWYPEWSPDGQHIAFTTFTVTGVYGISVMDPDGSNVTPLYTHTAGPTDFEWSPDGTRFVFTDEGRTGVYVMNSDGTGVTMIRSGRRINHPSWSPDGTRILYDSASTLYTMNADGTGGRTTIRQGSWADWYKAPLIVDGDGDGVDDSTDNCPADVNPSQVDTDGDASGDACDPDDDNDGYTDDTEIAAGSDPLNAASTPEVCDGIDNDLDGTADDGFVNTDGDALANCIDPDDDNDGLHDAIDEDDLVASTRFRHNATAGYVAQVPANVTYFLEPGAWTNGIFYDIRATAAVGPSERLQIIIDGKFHIFDLVVRRCVSNPCQGQFSDPPAQLDVQAIQEGTELTSVLNDQPLVISVAEGATAKVFETTSGGVLTDVTVEASGVAGGVTINGLPLPVGATTAIGNLQATAKLSNGKSKSLNLSGTLTPSASSNGLNPLSEDVSIMVGPYLWTIAAGQFRRAKDGAYLYSGTVGGVQLSVQMKPGKGGVWTFVVNATPADLLVLPAAVGFRVGDDAGSRGG
jgi:dipeptidyl aminopeptidase/acylaminoacyl peptidase